MAPVVARRAYSAVVAHVNNLFGCDIRCRREVGERLLIMRVSCHLSLAIFELLEQVEQILHVETRLVHGFVERLPVKLDLFERFCGVAVFRDLHDVLNDAAKLPVALPPFRLNLLAEVWLPAAGMLDESGAIDVEAFGSVVGWKGQHLDDLVVGDGALHVR